MEWPQTLSKDISSGDVRLIHDRLTLPPYLLIDHSFSLAENKSHLEITDLFTKENLYYKKEKTCVYKKTKKISSKKSVKQKNTMERKKETKHEKRYSTLCSKERF